MVDDKDLKERIDDFFRDERIRRKQDDETVEFDWELYVSSLEAENYSYWLEREGFYNDNVLCNDGVVYY